MSRLWELFPAKNNHIFGSELGLAPKDVVVSSGIGQAAKMPQYVSVNYYNGLHGRAMPVATAVKMANPELTVIAEGGDGGTTLCTT